MLRNRVLPKLCPKKLQPMIQSRAIEWAQARRTGNQAIRARLFVRVSLSNISITCWIIVPSTLEKVIRVEVVKMGICTLQLTNPLELCTGLSTVDAENVNGVVIVDADMIIRGPIVPWELGAEKGKALLASYFFLSSGVMVVWWHNFDARLVSSQRRRRRRRGLLIVCMDEGLMELKWSQIRRR
ncbi:hypothetical protein TB2_019118 [Malus domestica]